MIDAHIHLDDKRFDACRKDMIREAKNAGIEKFITPAVQSSGFIKLKELSGQFNSILPCYGLHPYFVASHQKKDIELLDEWLGNNKSYALGECGLDFYLKELDQQKQLYYFQAQIELAKKNNLPLILHARGAIDAILNCLKNANYFNAMIHSYNGSIQQTKNLLNYGVKFSFGGAICHPRAHKLHKLIKYCPTDSLMFETDAPDQNLYPDFKELNLPINLIKIISFYADITQFSIKEAIAHSTKVSQHFFQF